MGGANKLTVCTVANIQVPYSSDSCHGSRTPLAPCAIAFYEVMIMLLLIDYDVTINRLNNYWMMQ